MTSEKPTLKVEHDPDDDTMYAKAHYIVAYDLKDAQQHGHVKALAMAYLNASKVFVDTARALLAERVGVEVVKDDDLADTVEDLKQSN